MLVNCHQLVTIKIALQCILCSQHTVVPLLGDTCQAIPPFLRLSKSDARSYVLVYIPLDERSSLPCDQFSLAEGVVTYGDHCSTLARFGSLKNMAACQEKIACKFLTAW